jgi:nucleotide sugar dehydrogenase
MGPGTHHPDAPRTDDVSSVCVIGNGYVGTVVAASLSLIGHSVVGLESDAAKLAALRSGRAPFHEPGLDELLEPGLERGNLAFTDDPEKAVARADIVFLCVGSPSHRDGSVDLRPLESACRTIARWLGPEHVLVIKTTVPVGTTARLGALVRRAADLHPGRAPSIVSNPEFLCQGSAVKEFLHPDRIVLGGDDERALDALVNVYRPILEQRFPGAGCRKPILVRTTPAVAEAAKYAANAFLAAKVSFINEMANICDRVGADIAEVARIIGLDHRVGPEFLQAGLGWGGSCFAKDLDALIMAAREVGYDPQLLQAARDVNQRQLEAVMAKLQRHLGLLGARVALLGLAFKPGTDDLRGAPALRLAQSLQLRGALVTAFDPLVRAITDMPDVRVTKDPYEAADGADAVVLVTDWPELRKLDVVELRSRMRGDVLVDGRNALDPRAAARAGLVYEGMGRGEVPENSRQTALVRSFRSLGDGGFAASADANLDATAFQSRAVDGNGQSATEVSSWETSNDEPDTVAGLWVS